MSDPGVICKYAKIIKSNAVVSNALKVSENGVTCVLTVFVVHFQVIRQFKSL